MTDHNLYLLRHAKSAWDEPLPDHDRPLAERGVRDARAAGQVLSVHKWRPDLVLCSTAVRATQTWHMAMLAGAEATEVRLVDDVYDASVATLLDLIREVPEEVGNLLLVGHAPGLPDLAATLGSRPEPQGVWARMDAKYPTSGIAVLRLTGSWADAGAGQAELLAFEVPRG